MNAMHDEFEALKEVLAEAEQLCAHNAIEMYRQAQRACGKRNGFQRK